MTTAHMKDFLNRNDCYPDSLVQVKDMIFVARRGFFYTFGKTAQDFADQIVHALEDSGCVTKVTVFEVKEVYYPFRGGASVAKSSHWYVRFTV